MLNIYGPSSSSRRSRHHTTVPPREYTDLTEADIKLLAAVFAVPPRSRTSAHAAYDADVRAKISALPSHLRCKLSKLSTFCSLHDKINPLPVVSLLEAVQREVAPENLRKWRSILGNQFTVLETMNAIWTSPSHFRDAYDREPAGFEYHSPKCAACRLANVASSVSALTALGGVIIGGIKPCNWKKSKRIRFVEEWIKASVEFSYQVEGAVMSVWDLGVDLANHAAAAPDGGLDSESRSYIDDFVAQVQSTPRSNTPAPRRSGSKAPVRPNRQTMQNDHVAVTAANVVSQYAPYAANPFDDEEQQLRTPTTAGARSSYDDAQTPRQSSASAQSGGESRRPVAVPRTPRGGRSVPVASSIYSRAPDGDASISLLRGSDADDLATPKAPWIDRYHPAASSIYSRAVDEGDERHGGDDDYWRSSRRLESQIIDSYRRPSTHNTQAHSREFL